MGSLAIIRSGSRYSNLVEIAVQKRTRATQPESINFIAGAISQTEGACVQEWWGGGGGDRENIRVLERRRHSHAAAATLIR